MAKKETNKWTPSDDLILAALKFRSLNIWKSLDDSNIFALRQPDGSLGYCCIMGNGGTHYSLALYRAGNGFNTYLSTISHGNLHPLAMEVLTAFYEMISCDFENASDCGYSKAEVARFREIAAKNAMKIARSKGFPEFIDLHDGSYNAGYSSQADADAILTALNAAIWLAGEIKAKGMTECGFDPECNYVSPQGGSEIPLVTADGKGGFELSTTVTPPYTGLNLPAPLLTDRAAIKSISKLPSRNVDFNIGAILMPARVATAEEGFIPLVFLLTLNGQSMPLMPSNLRHRPEEILDHLGDMFKEIGFKPKKIDVYDPATQSVLRDFCEKCGIGMELIYPSNSFIDAMMFLTASMSRF